MIQSYSENSKYKKLQNSLITFCVSFDLFAFDPNTSLPCDWRELLWVLDPEEGCPLPLEVTGCLSLDPEEDAGAGSYFKGFPSRRLPAPVKGLNFGSASAGAS